MVITACFRFYAELNVFLAPRFRQRPFAASFAGDATVKHVIEALGVPHTEIELILVNGEPVDFSCRLSDADAVSVYPCFSTIDIAPLKKLRPPLAAEVKLIADAHLGSLAKNLRILGFNVLYRNDYQDAEIARIAAQEDRIVLTRDRDLLIRKDIVRGCYVHAVSVNAQLAEVIGRFKLTQNTAMFSRCLTCNGLLQRVDKEAIQHRVPAHSRQFYEHFYECEGCQQVFWEGSHVKRMRQAIAQILPESFIEKEA